MAIFNSYVSLPGRVSVLQFIHGIVWKQMQPHPMASGYRHGSTPQSSMNSQDFSSINHPDWLVVSTYPSEKSWSEFVSWDDMTFPTECTNKSHLPNHQPFSELGVTPWLRTFPTNDVPLPAGISRSNYPGFCDRLP